jgi:hypothetical protein
VTRQGDKAAEFVAQHAGPAFVILGEWFAT